MIYPGAAAQRAEVLAALGSGEFGAGELFPGMLIQALPHAGGSLVLAAKPLKASGAGCAGKHVNRGPNRVPRTPQHLCRRPPDLERGAIHKVRWGQAFERRLI